MKTRRCKLPLLLTCLAFVAFQTSMAKAGCDILPEAAGGGTAPLTLYADVMVEIDGGHRRCHPRQCCSRQAKGSKHSSSATIVGIDGMLPGSIKYGPASRIEDAPRVTYSAPGRCFPRESFADDTVAILSARSAQGGDC
ncbi:MAG: hypothetical protein AAFO01_17665 [Pseudomonadota bacterium]